MIVPFDDVPIRNRVQQFMSSYDIGVTRDAKERYGVTDDGRTHTYELDDPDTLLRYYKYNGDNEKDEGIAVHRQCFRRDGRSNGFATVIERRYVREWPRSGGGEWPRSGGGGGGIVSSEVLPLPESTAVRPSAVTIEEEESDDEDDDEDDEPPRPPPPPTPRLPQKRKAPAPPVPPRPRKVAAVEEPSKKSIKENIKGAIAKKASSFATAAKSAVLRLIQPEGNKKI